MIDLGFIITVLIVLFLIYIFVRLMVVFATNRFYQTSTAIKNDIENFKIPKVKIPDLIGYAGYQLFEMAKPGIEAKISGWAKNQASDIILTPDKYEVDTNGQNVGTTES